MKISKTILAGLLVAALPGAIALADSVPVLRIAGAATFRPPVQKAIEDALVSSGTKAYTFGWNGTAGNHYKPNASIYHGWLKSDNTKEVIIETYWTGDVSGVVDLTEQNQITKWIPTDSTTLASLSGTNNIANGQLSVSAPPNVTISVSFASSSAAVVSTAGVTGANISDIINGTTLTDAGSSGAAGGAGTVGVAAFQWVVGNVNSSFPVPFTNITQGAAYSLINQGSIPVSFLTGASGDQHKYAVLVGRSEDAGARTVPFAEAQTGFGNSTYQYALTFSSNQTVQADNRQTGGTGATVTGAAPWPANAPLNTEPNINWNSDGHSGYNLTSDLANVLSATNPVAKASFTVGLTNLPADLTHAYFVGYNGVADTGSLVTAGGTALSYNGVPYSVAAVQNGQYSLWSFAHVYYIGDGPNQLTGVLQQAANDIADTIYSTDADINSSGAHSSTTGAGLFFNSSVVVTRSIEGGGISQTY